MYIKRYFMSLEVRIYVYFLDYLIESQKFKYILILNFCHEDNTDINYNG